MQQIWMFVFVISFHRVESYKCLYDVYYFNLVYQFPTDSFIGSHFNDSLVCGLENNCGEYANWIHWGDECREQKEGYITCDFTFLKFKDFEMKILGVRRNRIEVIKTIRHSNPQPCYCYNLKKLLPKKIISHFFKDGRATFRVENLLQNVDPSFLTYSIKLYEGDNFVRNIMENDVLTMYRGTELEIMVDGLKDCHFYNLRFSFHTNRCQLENENVSIEKKYDVRNNSNKSCKTKGGGINLELSFEQIVLIGFACFVVFFVIFSMFWCYLKRRQKTNNLNLSVIDVRQNSNHQCFEPIYTEIDK